MTTEGALVEAAAVAPTTPGVYFFLDDQRRLVYVGKAVNLRRRLQQHAKETPLSARSKYARVRFVAWEEVADDDAACAREADLIVALQPAQNAALAGNGRWAYIVVSPGGDETCSFALVSGDPPLWQPNTAVHGGIRLPKAVYGCFPHLGKGQSSRPGIACSDGYAALLRVLWATGSTRPYPRTISGTSPPLEVSMVVPPTRRAALHRLLSGTSRRLLDDLSAAVGDVEAYLRPALQRDLALAGSFFDHGPAAIRRLRLRHGIPAGPLPRARIEALLHDEVVAAIGDVVLAGPSERARRRVL